MATSNNFLCVTQRSCQDNNERTDGKQTLAIFLKLKTKNVRNQWKRLFVVAEWCCRWFYCCAFLWGNFLAICSFCGRQKNQLPCWCQMKASYVMENGNIWVFLAASTVAHSSVSTWTKWHVFIEWSGGFHFWGNGRWLFRQWTVQLSNVTVETYEFIQMLTNWFCVNGRVRTTEPLT